MTTQSIPRPQPVQLSKEHINVWCKDGRLMDTEELLALKHEYEWVLTLADAEADEWPDHITENSRLNAMAVIAAVDAELNWRESKGISKPASSLGWNRELLDRLKAAVRIEDEVSRTVALKRRGKVLRGSCPFHQSVSGLSFVVFPDTGRWWCFGCQYGGDVITWQMATGHITFREAVQYLAAMAGVEIPRPKQPRYGGRRVIQKGRR